MTSKIKPEVELNTFSTHYWGGNNRICCKKRIMCGSTLKMPILSFLLLNIGAILFDTRLLYPMVEHLVVNEYKVMTILLSLGGYTLTHIVSNVLWLSIFFSDPGIIPRSKITPSHLSMPMYMREEVNYRMRIGNMLGLLKFCGTC